MNKGQYRSFGIELVLDFIVMYLVMYTMIATLDHFYLNLNNVYMTLMMVTPMAILMCEQASIRDPEILALCDRIVRAQDDEIAQMQAILKRL